jgi:ABC-type transport system involved in cytochrome c biogenesis permease subunit
MLGALMSGNAETVLRIFPPADKKEEVWMGPGLVLQEIIGEGKINQDHLAMLSLYEDVYLSAPDGSAFKNKVQILHDHIVKAAAARNQSGHVAMEINYHNADYFYYALICFILACLSLALSWTAPQALWGRLCRLVCWLSAIGGAVLGTMGIVIRCLIMGRPPITTLYETILFITITGVVLALIAEWMTKKGLSLTVACIAGMAGMFLSIRFMNMEGSDTLQQLQAVLITNFWLSTHVPCINLGYAAGMVAAIFSMIYFVQRLVGKVKAGDPMAKDISRIAYGFVMAGLFLSLVGTVLGGIWANYSWGRFWGWDPKENGALMIVLMNLIILHARLGGYIREVGFHACNLILGMIVAFSWFGTNQLGVGLHAYGFTDGVWKWLYTFWGSQTVLLLYAVYLSFKDRRAPKSNAAVAPAGKAARTA